MLRHTLTLLTFFFAGTAWSEPSGVQDHMPPAYKKLKTARLSGAPYQV